MTVSWLVVPAAKDSVGGDSATEVRVGGAGSGLDVSFHWAFGDHHSYFPDELRRLAQQALAAGAEALVTTEKDMFNLFEGAAKVVAPLRLYWLKIGIEIENEEELLRLIG